MNSMLIGNNEPEMSLFTKKFKFILIEYTKLKITNPIINH